MRDATIRFSPMRLALLVRCDGLYLRVCLACTSCDLCHDSDAVPLPHAIYSTVLQNGQWCVQQHIDVHCISVSLWGPTDAASPAQYSITIKNARAFAHRQRRHTARDSGDTGGQIVVVFGFFAITDFFQSVALLCQVSGLHATDTRHSTAVYRTVYGSLRPFTVVSVPFGWQNNLYVLLCRLWSFFRIYVIGMGRRDGAKK